jgi:hypothetical protein
MNKDVMGETWKMGNKYTILMGNLKERELWGNIVYVYGRIIFKQIVKK